MVRAVRQEYGDDLSPGDVFIANHPYETGAAHVPDLTTLAPIFHDGRLVAYCGNIAHKADFGGAVPGSVSGQATELYQEGLLLPPVRLIQGGRPVAEVERIVRANVRNPALVMGDVRTQVGVARLGAERVASLFERYGAATLAAAFDATLAASARALRSHLAGWRRGTNAAEAFLDDDGVNVGQPVRLHVVVTVEDERVRFDFRESADQTRGPLNLRPSLVEGTCHYALLAMTDPELPYNDGIRPLVDVVLRPGSVLAAQPPAPVSSYIMTIHRLTDLVLEALAPFCPERATAHGGGSGGSITIGWGDAVRTGRSYVQYEIFGSAYGGSHGQDGESGVSVHLANLQITPIEIVESEFPARVTRFELIPDSGGTGRWRGGLGFRRDYEVLQPGRLIRRADRVVIPPRGLAGGAPGRASRFVLHPDSPEPRVLPASATVALDTGDTFRIETAGGGGYGSPAERDPAAAAEDRREGRVADPG
jgi:N-methylhydantoinase B